MFDKLKENIRSGTRTKLASAMTEFFAITTILSFPLAHTFRITRGCVSPFNHANHRTRAIRAKEKIHGLR